MRHLKGKLNNYPPYLRFGNMSSDAILMSFSAKSTTRVSIQPG